MPIYITYMKLTQKGAENIKEVQQRIAEGAQWIQAAGGRVIGAYATLGRYDYLYITEFRDTKSAWPVLVKAATRGTVSTETVEAIPIDEFVQIVAKA